MHHPDALALAADVLQGVDTQALPQMRFLCPAPFSEHLAEHPPAISFTGAIGKRAEVHKLCSFRENIKSAKSVAKYTSFYFLFLNTKCIHL